MAYKIDSVHYSSVVGIRNTTTAIGVAGTGGIDLTAAYVHQTSGSAAVFGFFAAEAQSSAALTVSLWVSAATGSPTSIVGTIYATSTSQSLRASGAALGTSAAVDCTGAGGTWKTFTFSSVTLTQGEHYWLVIDNQTATPASHHCTIITKSCYGENLTNTQWLLAGWDTAGWTGDLPNLNTAAFAPIVIKQASGLIYGNPYVSRDAQANNSNDRGTRFRFNEKRTFTGVNILDSAASYSGVKVYPAGSASAVAQGTITNFVKNRGSTGGQILFDATWQADKNTDYDVVITMSASSTLPNRLYMGEASPPADVQACATTIGGTKWGLVTGVAASYTYDPLRIFCIGLVEDDNPGVSSATVVYPMSYNMGNLGSWAIDDYLVIPVATHDPETGVLKQPGTLSYSIYHAPNSTGVISTTGLDENVSITPGSPFDGRTGLYAVTRKLTAAAGFVSGDQYVLTVQGTVSAIPFIMTGTFQVGAKVTPSSFGSGSINNAAFHADVGSTAWASNTIAQAVSKSIANDCATKSQLTADILSGARPSGAVVDDAGNSASQFKSDMTQTADNFWGLNCYVKFTSGNLTDQLRKFTYAGATKTFSFTEAFTEEPAADDTFVIVNV